jgi:hypothetical protein
METERQKSEFNMAVSYLNRMNQLFFLCNQASIELDAYFWFHTLMALFRELSTEMDKDQIEKFTTKSKNINIKVANVLKKFSGSGRREIPPDLYTELHSFEMDLRNVLEKAGLQSKKMDDASLALK